MDNISETNINNVGFVAEGNININAQNAIGGDQINENYYDTEWITVNTASYSPENYISPVFTLLLLGQLTENNLIILAGGTGFDKDAFARHLAYLLEQDIESKSTLEKIAGDKKPKELFSFIKEKQDTTVFILNEFAPKNIGFDADELCQAARGKHYIILITDLELKTWQLKAHQEKKYWFQIPSTNLYSQEAIANVLAYELSVTKYHLTFENKPKKIDTNATLSGNKTIAQIATSFQTPEQVRFFIDLLSAEPQPILADALNTLLNSFSDKTDTLVARWFKNINTEKEKLMVIAAALLDGVYEDQFFEVLRRITEEFWHYRDSSLYALDYVDLDFLLGFFKFDGETGKGTLIKSRFPFQRAEILHCAWQTHRRHIAAAIPVLETAAQQSRYKSYMKQELHSTRHKRQVLRETIAETFSDIGLEYLPAVESKLLKLAATNDDSLQRIVAKAIVRWKSLGKEEQLYKLIWRWLENDEAGKQIEDILHDGDEGNTSGVISPRAKRYLYNVVIRALQYITEDEAPNQLSAEVIKLVEYILDKPIDLTAEHYKVLVSKLLLNHFYQIRPLFTPEFITNEKRSEFIVNGLLEAYENYTDEVEEWLNNWANICLQENNSSGLLLQTVLNVYIKLPINNEQNFLQLCETIKELYVLGKDRVNPALFYAIISKLIAIDTEAALPLVKFLFSYSAVDDRQQIIKCFTPIYRHQRQGLENAPAYTIIDGERYPFWYSSRPLTGIEQTMYRWMNASEPLIKDIAVLALAYFAIDFDKKEKRTEPILYQTLNFNSSTIKPNYSQKAPEYTFKRSPTHLVEPYISLYNKILFFILLLFENQENRVLIKQYIRTLLQHPFTADIEGMGILGHNLLRRNDGKTNRVARWIFRINKIRQTN